jgi:hypothetical protein
VWEDRVPELQFAVDSYHIRMSVLLHSNAMILTYLCITNRLDQSRLYVAKWMAGVEFHHEHRVLYKSLPEHHDYLYTCIK